MRTAVGENRVPDVGLRSSVCRLVGARHTSARAASGYAEPERLTLAPLCIT